MNSSERPDSTRRVAEFAGVTVDTVYRWIRTGKLKAIKQGKTYEILFGQNGDFLLAQLKKKRNKVRYPWTPGVLKDYSEWHEVIDEICWLIKICYSPRKDVKRRHFRVDRLFVNYLTIHKVALSKVHQVFSSNPSPSFRAVTDDLKRGWYSELSYAVPLRKSTLGLSFSDITLNKEDSTVRYAFPSWRITSAYYSVYFYLRAITLQKHKGVRIQEHVATILGFKNNLLQPLMRVLWKFPFDIAYTPGAPVYKRNLLIERLAHTRFGYANHPRPPHRSAIQTFNHIYAIFRKKGKKRTKLSSYTLFDYLHDFRVWANYLDIDNLLSLWGSGYKTFIDQNLSLLLFFTGGISEICYLSVFGVARYLAQLQSLYDLFVANNPKLESEFINTPVYQRLLIFNSLGLVHGIITLKTKDETNVVVTTPNIP